MLAARAKSQVENDKVISSRRPEGNLKRLGNHREFFDEAFVFTKLSSNSNNLFFPLCAEHNWANTAVATQLPMARNGALAEAFCAARIPVSTNRLAEILHASIIAF